MPAMTFRAPIILIKDILKGTGVGYNSTYISDKDMRIAMVQAGYADGVPVSLANRGSVYLGEKSLNIIGKVSMDLICVDLQDTSAEVGDFVDIWGGKLNSLELVKYLDKYAETGIEYTKILSIIIKQNSLTEFDDVKILPTSKKLKNLI